MGFFVCHLKEFEILFFNYFWVLYHEMEKALFMIEDCICRGKSADAILQDMMTYIR
jgi:hypothetical protein